MNVPTEDELEQQLLKNLGLISKDEQTETNDNKNEQKAGDRD